MAYCAFVDMRPDTVMRVANSLPGLFASLFGVAGFPVPAPGNRLESFSTICFN
jgi:hypothetical protein